MSGLSDEDRQMYGWVSEGEGQWVTSEAGVVALIKLALDDKADEIDRLRRIAEGEMSTPLTEIGKTAREFASAALYDAAAIVRPTREGDS